MRKQPNIPNSLITIYLIFLSFLFGISMLFLKYNEKINLEPLEPLYLTPFIRNGSIQEAQQASQVNHWKFLNIRSHSGYLTINDTTNSHLFFWYFPAMQETPKSRLILWLSGGPGFSSLYGLFMELGPFKVASPKFLSLREYSWNAGDHLLFIDNPVGTGFSLTQNGYVTNQVEVGRDLYLGMKQFLQLFPHLASKEFFIAGESYAGKYIPALGHRIHLKNQEEVNQQEKINLKGLLIGNGLVDPINQLNYADFLFMHGLIDQQQAKIMKNHQELCFQYINEGRLHEASRIYSDLMTSNPEFTRNGNLIENFTGFSNLFDYTKAEDYTMEHSYMVEFLRQDDIKRALHVGNHTFRIKSMEVSQALSKDWVKSVVFWLSELLSHYRVLLYAGQLDIIVAYPLIANYVSKMNFSSKDEYKVAPRLIWHYQNDIAGYFKIAGNLTEVLVRNAGHLVPHDQPKWAYDLLDRFIHNKPFN